MNIAREEILVRRSFIPQVLLDEIYSGVNDQVLLQLQTTYQFSDTVLFAIEKKCQLVFLGFLRIKDLFEELVQDVKLDSKTALAVFQVLDEKVFSAHRAEIEDNYRLFQTQGAVSEVAPLKTQEQVVLRRETTPDTVTLSFKNISTPETPPKDSSVQNTKAQPAVPPPISIVVNQQNLASHPINSNNISPQIKPASSTPNPTPASINISSASPAQSSQSTQSLPIKNEQPRISQTISPNMFAVPNSTPVDSNGPIVLHKKEEVTSIGQAATNKGYKPMSFGSFMGSFKTPQNKEVNISRAEVEMPMPNNTSTTPQQVPFSVKKYDSTNPQPQGESAKVVHYDSNGEIRGGDTK